MSSAEKPYLISTKDVQEMFRAYEEARRDRQRERRRLVKVYIRYGAWLMRKHNWTLEQVRERVYEDFARRGF